jgi:hypothetical protein
MSNYQTVFTIDQIVANFRRGIYANAAWTNLTSLTYGFATSASAYPGNYGPEVTGFSPFTSQQQQAATMAIQLWTDVANIPITQAADGNNSNLRFANSTSMAGLAEGFIPGISDYYSGDMWFNPLYSTNRDPLTFGNYGFITLLHEIGHALGLPHPGDYNADNGTNPTYQTDALYQQDTRQYTVMSYFAASNTGAFHGSYYASTPLVDDIAAIQYIYGPNMTTRTGDTVYGFNSTAGRPEFDFTVNTHPIVAIWDAGGNDTIDLSGSSSAARIDLTPGAFSDVMGFTKNLAIAYGTNIENAIGSSGADNITGNDLNNYLSGGPGNDNLFGGLGNDTEFGGTGNDYLYGQQGNDILEGDAGNDTLVGGPGVDDAVYSSAESNYGLTRDQSGDIIVSGPDGTDTLLGIEKLVFSDQTMVVGDGPLSSDFNVNLDADILWQSSSGQPAIWLMNGATLSGGATAGANPGTAWRVVDSADFNGDGAADILWQNTDGSGGIWFMDGTNVIGGGALSLTSGPWLHMIGAGDFNGDGQADILWQNSGGKPVVWLMNGTSVLSTHVTPAVDSTWRLVGAGDFNGDGQSDLLWQNVSGQVAIWIMQGGNYSAAALVGTNPGSTWRVKASADFNGDGISDILWQNDDGTPAIWFLDNTGAKVGGGVPGSNPGSSWQIKGAADFNGDGYADILWQNTDGTPGVWLMNGTTVVGGGILPNPGSSWNMLTMST